MNKGDLINKIANDADITKAQAAEALTAVINGIGGTLKAGDKVTLVDLELSLSAAVRLVQVVTHRLANLSRLLLRMW